MSAVASQEKVFNLYSRNVAVERRVLGESYAAVSSNTKLSNKLVSLVDVEWNAKTAEGVVSFRLELGCAQRMIRICVNGHAFAIANVIRYRSTAGGTSASP